MTDDTVNIYFDNNSTTPVSAGALNVLNDISKKYYGNPSSITSRGRSAKALLIDARKDISSFLGCNSSEIVFTSGGTEALHTIIHGIIAHRHGSVVTTKIEHKAVLESIQAANKPIDYLAIDKSGTPKIEDIAEKLQNQVAAIILSLVNGETGAVLPLKEIAEIAKERNIPLIIDGVAGLGKMPITIYKGITAMAFSGHKCHGPKGTGFFYLRDNTEFSPLFNGGGQESGRRSGTENVAGIVSLERAISEMSTETYSYLLKLRLYFEKRIRDIFPNCTINGCGNRVSNVSNIHFEDIDGDHLLIYLDQNGIAASLGSACASGALEPSHVLLGMGYSRRRASSSLRFSFSRINTIPEIDKLCDVLELYKIPAPF